MNNDEIDFEDGNFSFLFGLRCHMAGSDETSPIDLAKRGEHVG